STGLPQPPEIFGGLRPDGRFIWLYGNVVPLTDADGRIRLGAVSFFDITSRIEAENKLRDSEESQRLIVELTHDYAYTCDVNSPEDIRMTSVTEGFTRVTGYSYEEIMARGGWLALIHPDDVPKLGGFTETLLTGENGVNEVRILTKQGEMRWIRFSTRPLWDNKQNRVVRLLGAVQDITERKLAEEGLAESRRRLQLLSHRLLEVQEQERRHLARELHDEIGQNLTGLQLILEMCRRTQGESQQTRLVEAQRLVQELAGRVRDLSLDLRPSMLDDDLGLLPALRFLCRRYATQTSIQVHLDWHGAETRFPSEQETAIYRIVQEALTNAARHACVKELTVEICATPDWLEAVIADQGKGFVPESVLVGGSSSGLSGMYERATLLGGSLRIESAPGCGTRISARLPLADPDHEDE
ncbi:MAG: PAS domain S-box protein, partial [Gemmataceae bacterium]